MNPRELNGYAESLTAIQEDIAAFQLGWRWPADIIRGVNFGRTDLSPLGQIAIEVNVERKEELTPEALSLKVFDNLLPSTNGLEKKLLQPYPTYGEDPTGKVRNDRFMALRKALFQDVLPNLLPIANAMIERAVKAAQEGEIEKHNRKTHLHKLAYPIQSALWDGVTVEDITKLAQAIAESSPKTPPTLQELLVKLGAQLKDRG